MANYSYVVSSGFSPFTFQEMLTPYTMYKEEYDKQQEAADKLAEKALVWDNMVNQETDPETYQKIKNYTDQLKAQAESFANHGLSIRTGAALADLRRRYSSEMTPIEQGYAAKKAQIAEQLKAKAQDPTLLISRRAETTSLDDYVKNPMLSYEVLSGSSLTKRVATQAASLANQLSKAENYGQLDDCTKLWMQQYGFTPSQVLQAINSPGTEESTKVLNAIVDSVVDSSGIKNWGDQEALNTARMYANEGLYSAIGKSAVDQYADYKNRLDAQNNAELELFKELQKYKVPQQSKTSSSSTSKGNNSGNNGGETKHYSRLQKPVRIRRTNRDENEFEFHYEDPDEEKTFKGSNYTPEMLSENWLPQVQGLIGDDALQNYTYFYNEDDDELYVVPKSSTSDTYKENTDTYDYANAGL